MSASGVSTIFDSMPSAYSATGKSSADEAKKPFIIEVLLQSKQSLKFFFLKGFSKWKL